MNPLPWIYALVIATLAYQILRFPAIVLRPSVWLCIPFLLRIGGAATFSGTDIELGYHLGFELRLLTLLFPLGVVAWVTASPGITALGQNLYRASMCFETAGADRHERRMITLAIAGCSVLVVLTYLAVVPLQSTGLMTIINDPVNAAIAREEGLKLLGSPVLAYAFTIFQKLLAPLLVALLALWQTRRWGLLSVVRVVLILAVVVCVMLPGARAPAGRLIMVLALVQLFRRGIVRGGFMMVIAISAALVVAAVLTLMRQGQLDHLSVEALVGILQRGIFDRAFVTPFETGVWTNLYAQDHGLLGVHGIRPLALLFGQEHVRIANEVAIAYSPTPTFSSNANTSFLFDFQAAFGLIPGWGVALVCITSLDFLLFAFRKLRAELLAAFLCTMLISLTALISTSFTTSLLSHGIVPVAFFAYVSGCYVERRHRGAADGTASLRTAQ